MSPRRHAPAGPFARFAHLLSAPATAGRKPRRRRSLAAHRALRLESLESRAMLSAAPFIAELPQDLAGRTTSLVTVHGRYGNNALNGDWELGMTSNTSAPPQHQINRTWNSGAPESFTFEITKIPASLTAPAATSGDFTIGGSNVKASYTDIASYEPNAIKIWARSTTTGSGVTINDLKIKTPGVPGETVFPGTVINVSQDLGPVFQEIIIAGVDFTSMSSGTVTLEGNVTMQFGADPALRGSALQFHIIATHIPWVDLDVDSNNIGGIDPVNGRRGSDDPIEQAAPGLIIPVGGDRAEMRVAFQPGQNPTLTITEGAHKVRVFDPTGKEVLNAGTNSIKVGGTSPQTFTIEAIAPSTSAGDIVFTLTGDPNGPPARDIVCITAVPPSLNIDATDAEADEVMTARDNPNTGSFRLSRSGDTSKDLPVKIQVSGTATYSAWATDDYTLDIVHTGLTGYFVTIPSGKAFVDIVCTPFQDGTNEDTETVTLTVAEYTGYTVGPRSQATVSILDAPDLSAASVAFRIDMGARPAARCWPVDAAERRLPQVPQDTLRTGEPYVFSLADIGTERTAGVTWELSYDIIQAIGAPGGAVTITTSSGSAAGTSFPRTFAVDEERVTTLFGTTMHDRWHVHFFVDANRNGRRDSDESFAVGRFNEVLQDRKAIWLCRLEEEKKAHAGTIYNDVFGITAFFDELIATVKNVSFGRNSDPNALAIYGFMTNTIGVNDAENIEGGITTIIHESVHAFDDARNWPPPLGPVLPKHFDTVEAIAWTAQHLLNRQGSLMLLRNFEDSLLAPNPDSFAIESLWKLVVQHFHLFTDDKVVGRPWGNRPLTLDDVQTTRAAVGLHYNMANLMVAYQQRLNDAGVPVTLTSGVQIGPGHYEIPPVFLE